MGIEHDNRDDEKLILSVLSGNKEDFGILFNRYAGMWLMYAYNLCGNYDTSADIVQEALLRAYKSLDRIRDFKSFPSWVAGIIKNTYRNLERKKSIPTIPLDNLKDKGFEPSDSDTFSSPKKYKEVSAMKYISQLPEKYKEVIMLRFKDDCSYRKIADILGIPETTVTMRIAYARRMLIQSAKEDGLL